MKSLLRLKPYLWRYKKTLGLGLITVVMSNVFTVVQPRLIGLAIDELKKGIDARTIDGTALLGYAGLIVGLSLLAGIFMYFTRQTIIVVSRHIEFDLRNDFLRHLQKLSLKYFQNTPTGDLMAHATNDISAVRNVVGPGIMYPSDTIMTFTMVLVMMFLSNWELTLYALLPLPLVSFIVYRLGKKIHKKFQERQEQFSILTSKTQENLSGIRVVQSYVREDYEINQFRKLSWEYMKKNLILAKIQSILWPLMFVLIGFSLVIIIYVGGLKVIAEELSIGTLTAFFGYLMLLIWPMIAFGWVTNLLQQGAASMERLMKIMDTVPDIRDNEETDYSITEIKGQVEFKNVSFKHEGSNHYVLKNISLTIQQGMQIAIVGYTGSGKSTFANLIPRLYEITEGEILIDGIPIKKIPLSVLRSNIGYVQQETFLFSDTIFENIAYGVNNPSQDVIMEAAEVSQIAKDIKDFPGKYNTSIGERGITLSGGQKQRTSIARALVRNPKILILDDALSSVDTYTEDEILKRLRIVMKNRTSIIISHRISTIKEADLIIVLDKGKIVERGNHDELLALGGIYADLYDKQLLEEELESM